MKLINAIEDFDNCRSNQLSAEQKIKWISELDHKIFCEYLQARGEESFLGYSSLTPCETVLKAPEEYSEIYSLYLNMKLDYLNGEITRFNNSTQLFNRLYKEMGDAINRKTKIPKNTKIKAGDLYV
jgi:hypothetical protein